MKRKFLLLVFLVLACASSEIQAQCSIENGLIHYYKFDGNTDDALGNNNATLSSTTNTSYVMSKDNIANGALDLGGFDKSLSITTIPVGTDFTISFWFRQFNGIMTVNAQTTGIGTYHDGTNPTTFIGVGGDMANSNFVNPGFGVFREFNPTFSGPSWKFSMNTPNTTWKLVTFIKTGDSVSIYEDNIFRGKEKTSQVITQMNYLLGQQTGSGNIKGAIDDYRIYNRALTYAEITQLFNGKRELQITQDIQAMNICPGETGAKLTAVCDSATQYDWYQDNNLIATTSVPELVFGQSNINNAGQYYVIAKNCFDADTSSTVAVTVSYDDLSTGLVAFYPYPNVSSNPGTPTGSLLPNNNSQGIQFNAPNRFSRGHKSVGVSNINTALVFQNNFSDSTSTTSFWYRYNPNNFGSVRHLVRSTNGNFAPVIAYQGKIGYDEPSGITWSTNQVFTPNAWHHIVLVRDGANAKIYVNKQLVVNRNNATSQQVHPITGFGGQGIYKTALGFYDDVRLYNYPVNQEMVDKLYSEIVRGYIERTGSVPGYTFCNGANMELFTYGNTSDTLNPVQYQWYKDGQPLNNSSRVSGARTDLLKVSNFTASDAGVYTCEQTTSCVLADNPTANVIYSANAAPVFSVSTQQPLCSGATGTNLINLISNVGPTPTIQVIYHNGNASQVTSPHTVAPGRHTYRVTNTSDQCPVTQTVQVMNPNEPIGVYDEFSNQNCGSFASTVSAASCGSVNGSQWFPIMNSQGKIVASVNPNGQNLGSVTATLHNEVQSVSEVNSNTNLSVFNPRYMHKTWVLNAANTITGPVNVRFHYMREDFDTLKAASACLGCTPQDLILSHLSGNNEDCDATNTTPTNFNLYWNKNVPNPVADNAMIQSQVTGTLNNLYHNQSLTNLGGANSAGVEYNGQYFEAVVNQFSEFRLHMLGNSAALPVHWLSFDAYKQNDQVVLDWEVAQEENCEGYTIQRSRNTREWKTIGTLSKKQNGLQENDYHYYDMPNQNGNWYYRIIQKDIDGMQSYSDIRMVNFEALTQTFKVYPNPTQGDVFYTTTNAKGSNIFVRSMTGQLLFTQKASTSGQLNMSALPAGVYMIQYITPQSQETFKLFKK
jgi:hypothetical protein